MARDDLFAVPVAFGREFERQIRANFGDERIGGARAEENQIEIGFVGVGNLRRGFDCGLAVAALRPFERETLGVHAPLFVAVNEQKRIAQRVFEGAGARGCFSQFGAAFFPHDGRRWVESLGRGHAVDDEGNFLSRAQKTLRWLQNEARHILGLDFDEVVADLRAQTRAFAVFFKGFDARPGVARLAQIDGDEFDFARRNRVGKRFEPVEGALQRHELKFVVMVAVGLFEIAKRQLQTPRIGGDAARMFGGN